MAAGAVREVPEGIPGHRAPDAIVAYYSVATVVYKSLLYGKLYTNLGLRAPIYSTLTSLSTSTLAPFLGRWRDCAGGCGGPVAPALVMRRLLELR